MECTPSKNADVDEQECQVSQYCLGLPTIVRQILERISSKELIELSLVNKLWNFEARSVMKDRGTLRAYFSSGGYGKEEDCPCQELEAFTSDLEKMRVVPFSGLHFPIDHRVVCKSSTNGSLQPSHTVIILDRMHWKHFSVSFGSDYWRNYKNCPALALVEQILKDNCATLEELTLGFANEEFLGPIFQDRTLPRLRYLRILSWGDDSRGGSVSSAFIKVLVSSAPNLEELDVNEGVDLNVNMLEGSSAVLVANFGLMPMFLNGLKPICEDLIGSVRLDEMTIPVHMEQLDPELLHSFIPKVLEASRTRLKTLVMDYLFAVPLMCYGICLENVTTLQIRMTYYGLEHIDPWTLALPRGLDFTRVFPKLNQVTILNDLGGDFPSDVVSAFVEQASAVLNRALPDRASNIKLLDIYRCGYINYSTRALLAQIFPDVKTVRANSNYEGNLFEDLREHFLFLEEVTESEYEVGF